MVSMELCRREHAGAQLVLEAIDLDAIGQAVLAAHFHIEQREPTPTRAVAFGPRERERHLRGGRRREPFGAVKAILLPARHGTRHALADRHVGSPGALRHPLTARPRLGGIAACKERDGAVDERLVSEREERLRGPVGHRERAGVDAARALEKVREGELMNPRVLAVLPLVGRRDDALLRGDLRHLAPVRHHLDVIHAPSPRVPLNELRLVRAPGKEAGVEVPSGTLAQVAQLGLDLGAHVRGELAVEIAPEHAVGCELVA
jgi:hypothetical protein